MNLTWKYFLTLGLGFCLASSLALAAPIHVLLLSGQGNHDWPSTTPYLAELLESTSRFQVTINEHPEALTQDSLKGFDVILSNWNTYSPTHQPADAAVSEWPTETRAAYLDIVRTGKGHVVVHAGSSSFADWPEYLNLTLASWQLGQTRHGPSHSFAVRIDSADHPITQGLSSFQTTDELWVAPGRHGNGRVLASGWSDSAQPQGSDRYEPTALAGSFGKGRTFTLLLGHDNAMMENAGFQSLLTRGTEWAATGKVTLPPISPTETTAGQLIWRQGNGSLALADGDQIVWQFNYAADESKPSFHPVSLAGGGPVMTGYRPDDHPWHRALWFSWKFINGVNYWEEDRETGVSAGRTRWTTPSLEIREDFSAQIKMQLTYAPGNDKPLLIERRTIEISPPHADGSYWQDWTLEFTALAQDVVFDRTPLPSEPNGVVYGGYAGLSVRWAAELKDVQVTGTAGPVVFEEGRYRGKAQGVDYSGTITGDTVGIAILDHPLNLNAPSPWYVINTPILKYYSPAVICYAPHTLPAGEAMTLRYRVWIHPDSWDPERLKTEVTQFDTDIRR